MYTSDEMFVLSFLGAYLGVVCILALVIAVLSIIANWKIYTKAGRPGWKCLIPVYNVYVLFDMVWETRQFWIYLAMFAAYYVFMLLGAGVSGIFTIFALLCGIAMLVWSIRLLNHLSACFGHGPWFTVGLLFLNTIFVMILAFGDSKYCHFEKAVAEKEETIPEDNSVEKEETKSEDEIDLDSDETE